MGWCWRLVVPWCFFFRNTFKNHLAASGGKRRFGCAHPNFKIPLYWCSDRMCLESQDKVLFNKCDVSNKLGCILSMVLIMKQRNSTTKPTQSLQSSVWYYLWFQCSFALLSFGPISIKAQIVANHDPWEFGSQKTGIPLSLTPSIQQRMFLVFTLSPKVLTSYPEYNPIWVAFY